MKNAKIDLHCHSMYSFDSEADPDEICLAAIERNIERIAITDHCDIDCIEAGFYSIYDASTAREHILSVKSKYADKLDVLFGVELGGAHVCPDLSAELVRKYKFDFVLGSLHNLKDVPDFSFIDYTEMPMALIIDLMRRNISELCEIARLPFINSIAHITYPYRYIRACGKQIEFSELYGEFSELFELIIRNGKALEVNTSPYRKNIADTMPEKELMELYFSLGGRIITVGSDAHTPVDLGAGTHEALHTLKSIGFTAISYYKNGERFETPIAELI